MLAYRHLLAATALSAQLSPEQQSATRKRIAKIGLPERDAQYYEAMLLTLQVRDELTRIGKDRASLATGAEAQSHGAIARLQLLRTQEDDLMRDAKELIVAGLTPQGAATLKSYVQSNVKGQIKILRGGHMSGAN